MKRLILVIFMSMLGGCLQHKQAKDIPIMNIGQNSYLKSEDFEEELVKYITLETNDDVLIESRRQLLYFSNNRIIMLNLIQGDIFVFDGNGKILSYFNHKGQGPEEYLDLRYAYGTVVVYDEISKYVYIMGNGRCQVYHENGTYLYSFYYSNSKQYMEAYSFDKETILAFDANPETDSAYVLISKKDGKVLSCIDIPLVNRISNIKISQSEFRTIVQSGLPKQQLLKNGEDFILAEISSDTIYKFTKDRKLMPLLTRIPHVHDGENNNEYLIFQPLKVTDRYVLGYKYIHNFNNAKPKITMLLFDIEKRQTFKYEGSSIEYYIGGYNIEDRTDLPANLYVMNSFPIYILNALGKGKLENTKLKEIGEMLHEDNNPILQVIKF
jgi:hypothetical protein